MKDKLFLGVGKQMIPIPRLLILLSFSGKIITKMMEKSLHNSMSKDHHAVSDLVVKELARMRPPMRSEFIAEKQSVKLP